MFSLNDCRLCQNRPGNVKLQGNSSLLSAIFHCIGLNLELNEDAKFLPKAICEQCKGVLELLQQFKAHCLLVDRVLRKNEQKLIENSIENLQSEDVEDEIIYLQFEDDADDLCLEQEIVENDNLQTCPICQVTFENIEEFLVHRETHNELYCTNCDTVFENIDLYTNHTCIIPETTVNINSLQTNTNNKPNVTLIPIIIKKTDNKNNVNIDNENSSHIEVECDVSIPISNVHNKLPKKKNRACEHCNKTFPNKQTLLYHMKEHIGSFVCDVEGCRKICASEYALKYHAWKHKNVNNRFLCNICGKSFQFASFLRQHEMRHSGIKEFKCGDCGKEFFRRGELKLHRKSHHGGFRYFCSLCPKSFITSINLVRHELVHKGIKQFICEECSHQFYTEKELIRHRKRSHEGVKPHVCEYCTKSFFEKTQYRIHVRCHTGERPFTCSNTNCNKSYYEKAHLKSHKKTCDRKITEEKFESKDQILLVLEDDDTHIKDLDIITGEYMC